MKNIGNNIVYPLLRWFLANAVFPIVIPILVLVAGDWFFADKIDIPVSAQKLLYEGFYIFSAMTLLFSLFEDYKAFQDSIKPVEAMILMIPMIGTCIIFYATERNGLTYFANHIIQFLSLWVVLALYAVFIKIKIIIYKQKYKY